MDDIRMQRLAGGIPASALDGADPVAVAAKATKLAALRGEVALGELVMLPLIPGGPGVQVWLELVGHSSANAIEAAVFKTMEAVGLPPLAIHAWTYDVNRKARTLAAAAKDPEDRKTPFATVEQWLDENDGMIVACALVYDDLKERLDPLGGTKLSDDDLERITEAWKKKETSFLRYCGVVTLTKFLLSGAVQPSTSQTPSSTSGPTSPESSARPQMPIPGP